ncbi:MAG: HAD-IIIA family hydrolase [Candidatus Cloacimonetes bacterium]|nr:HAD-IIIA family hydrolase [Candidatus Cloacimonadota bacterium]
MKDLRKIRLLLLDCDGVLTDGEITYGEGQIESKNFHVHDGLGIKLLLLAGVEIAVISGRDSEALKKRCEDLGITLLFQNTKNKKRKVEELLEKLQIDWEEVAVMGDDWNDLPMMEMAYFTSAPADCPPDIRKKVDLVTEKSGGRGAVRELIDVILKARDQYEKVLEDFFDILAGS